MNTANLISQAGCHQRHGTAMYDTWVGISSKVVIWVEVGGVICHHVLHLSSLGQQTICVSSRKGPEVMHVGTVERRVACCVLYSSS